MTNVIGEMKIVQVFSYQHNGRQETIKIRIAIRSK
jgi:hypothetical protein